MNGSTRQAQVLLRPLVIACAAALAGCATNGMLGMGTPYQASGWRGGYEETELRPGTFRITFTANQYTSANDAMDFALLRSAEIALERGYSHFAVINGSDALSQAQVSIPVTQYRSDLGRDVTTGFRMSTVSNPISTNTIVCFRGVPAQTGMVVMDAHKIYDQLTAKHGLTRRNL